MKSAWNTLVALCNVFECLSNAYTRLKMIPMSNIAVLLSHKSGTESPCEFCCRVAGKSMEHKSLPQHGGSRCIEQPYFSA